MRILFMGTPDFALFSLKGLVNSQKHDICGVVTQPDKPKGRGYTLMPPPVKIYALENNIPVYQPQTLKGEEFAALLDSLSPDLIAVAAYGKILPKNVIDYPKYGCINVHGSLLPEYRGAAPMQRAIIDGRTETGITIMYMAQGLDTGDMLYRVSTPIGENENFEDIHDRLGALGAKALLHTIEQISNGECQRVAQDNSLSTYAAKITKEDCRIDWPADARTIHNLIRGLSPVPLAFTRLPNQKTLKVISSALTDTSAAGIAPGTVLSVDNGIEVACGNGSLRILTLLPEGKGRMAASDFVRGRNISVGDVLS